MKDSYISEKIIPEVIDYVQQRTEDFGKYNGLNDVTVEIGDGNSDFDNGFISTTEGSLKAYQYMFFDYLKTNGEYPPNEKIKEIVESYVETAHEYAADSLLNSYGKELKNAGFDDTNITYNNLVDADLHDLAEELDDIYLDALSEDYFIIKLGCFFHRDRDSEGDYYFEVFTSVTDWYDKEVCTFYHETEDFKKSDSIDSIIEKIEKHVDKAVKAAM